MSTQTQIHLLKTRIEQLEKGGLTENDVEYILVGLCAILGNHIYDCDEDNDRVRFLINTFEENK